LLGAPQILVGSEPVAIERRKALALLAYLAVEPGPHTRDTLATLLWPDADHSSARAGLRRALAAISPIVARCLLIEQDRLSLVPDDALTLDVAQFRALLRRCPAPVDSEAPPPPEFREILEQAVALYRGDFLAGFSLPDSTAFDEWQFFQAETLRRDLAGALEYLARLPDSAQDLEGAIIHARRWLALDTLHEPAYRRLMHLYVRAGHVAAALRQYQLCVEALEELGMQPEPETTGLYEQIRLGERARPGSRWGGTPPTVSVPAGPPADVLPEPLTPFLGRETELAQLASYLEDPACRLITLVGPGGIGKTRLGLRAAVMHRHRFADGAAHVSLIGVQTSERLVATLADVLGITTQGRSDALDRICETLRIQQMLLVLDNFEQVNNGVDTLLRLLTSTQALKLLVTSRERLHLQGEWVLDIAGLEVPDDPAEAALDRYSAVQLFLQSARRVRADFTLSIGERPDVVRICQLVEGLPLAIELAAAWVRTLSCAEIADELEQSLALLSSIAGDMPERHRSIEAVFTQSWERLDEHERSVLRRLSVFEDGFLRPAAAEVAGATPTILATLSDKSLLRRDPAGRYTMHELLRQYVAARLAALTDEAEQIGMRHCRYYLRLVQQSCDLLQGPHQRATLLALSAEIDNIQSAWDWAVAHRMRAELDLAMEGLYRYADLRGWFQSGVAAFGDLVESIPAELSGPDSEAWRYLRARAQVRQGALLCWVGQFAQAQALLNSGLQTLREGGDPGDIALALNWLGMVRYQQDDYEEAGRLLREGLALYEALEQRHGIAWSLDALGDLAATRGDYATARQLLTESVNQFSALGDQASTAWSLNNLGRVLRLLGDHAEARHLFEEALGLFGIIGDQHGQAAVLVDLGISLLATDESAAARQQFREALQRARLVATVPLALDALVGLAEALLREGDAEQALELAALVLGQPGGWKETVEWAEQTRAAAREAFSPAAAARIERRGRTRSWEEAVA
jgi:predicted ATPase/DNA-binding SARP family transcriptional activator